MRTMRAYLQTAQWWAWVLMQGIFFGTVMAIYSAAQGHQSLNYTILTGVGVGAVLARSSARSLFGNNDYSEQPR